MLICFADIEPQQVVDDLCAEYRKVDALLKHPKYGLPMSVHAYHSERNGARYWHITRFFRNIGALERFEAFVDSLDTLFVAVQYFHGHITLERTKGKALTKEFRDRLFQSMFADSLRSSLDIFAMFLGWFFDFKHKETVGFSYKQFIQPLMKHCDVIARECNSIYKSPEYKYLKSLRDAEKHRGLGKHNIAITNKSGAVEIKAERPQVVDHKEFERQTCCCFNMVLKLVRLTTSELQRWPLGFHAPNDLKVKQMPDGTYWWEPSD